LYNLYKSTCLKKAKKSAIIIYSYLKNLKKG
jgi:hypothetical protein